MDEYAHFQGRGVAAVSGFLDVDKLSPLVDEGQEEKGGRLLKVRFEVIIIVVRVEEFGLSQVEALEICLSR